jgi:hypothetical protein
VTADYTPTTEQVKAAYVRAMRNAFIASEGEHREEFRRWLAAHDAEVAAAALTEAAVMIERRAAKEAPNARAALLWVAKFVRDGTQPPEEMLGARAVALTGPTQTPGPPRMNDQEVIATSNVPGTFYVTGDISECAECGEDIECTSPMHEGWRHTRVAHTGNHKPRPKENNQ